MTPQNEKGRPVPLHHDRNQIRASFLHKLGIYSDQYPGRPHRNYLRNNVIPSITFQHRTLRKNEGRYEKHQSQKSLAHLRADVESYRLGFHHELKHQKVVHFDFHVSVAEIPSHRDYSDSIRRCIWTGSDEIMENARRNTLEYRADGYDWRTVSEETDMHIDRVTGELIHPVHVVTDSSSISQKDQPVPKIRDKNSTQIMKKKNGDSINTSEQKWRSKDSNKRRREKGQSRVTPRQTSQMQCSLTRWADT